MPTDNSKLKEISKQIINCKQNLDTLQIVVSTQNNSPNLSSKLQLLKDIKNFFNETSPFLDFITQRLFLNGFFKDLLKMFQQIRDYSFTKIIYTYELLAESIVISQNPGTVFNV